MILNNFGEAVYVQFTLIYGNQMKYDASKLPVMKRMISNYIKQKENGKKVFVSRNK